MNNVTPLLPEPMKKFMTMLDLFPRLRKFWHLKNGTYRLDMEKLHADAGLLSNNEAIMLRFFICVFNGKQQEDFMFDLFQASQSLDSDHRGVICDWLRDPFWP